MKLSAQDFLNSPQKIITFLGMSGAGKTYISSQLARWGWVQYSCDYEIGTRYLKDDLAGLGGVDVEDIGALSAFLGKLGSQEHGGFPLDLFRKRQKAYYDAECQSIASVAQLLSKGVDGNFIHDSTGSLCEVEDETLLHALGEKTLFVYLQASEESEKQVLQRAQDVPKPLFFPADFLEENLQAYLNEFSLSGVDDIEPDHFSRWIFPKLFEARKPKYQRLADLYGVSIPAESFSDLGSVEDFVEIVARHLD